MLLCLFLFELLSFIRRPNCASALPPPPLSITRARPILSLSPSPSPPPPPPPPPPPRRAVFEDAVQVKLWVNKGDGAATHLAPWGLEAGDLCNLVRGGGSQSLGELLLIILHA